MQEKHGTFEIPQIKRTGEVRETQSSGKLKSIPEQLRPRELLLERGCSAVSDDLLLAILLRTGARGCNVIEMSRRLLHRYGSLKELATASPEELISLKIPGLGKVKAVELSATLEIARRVSASPVVRASIKEPSMVVDILLPLVADIDREIFLVLPLDRKNRLKGRPVQISEGTVDSSLVHPREVFRECVRVSAVSVIVSHNHPSGDPTPSAEDLRITRQLIEAGKTLGIPVLDHIIIGNEAIMDPGYISLRDKGYVKFSD